MPGLEACGDAKTLWLAKQWQHGGVATQESASVPPTNNDGINSCRKQPEPSVVFGPHGITSCAQGTRRGTAQREEVRDYEFPEAISLREGNTAPDRWVINLSVGT